MSTSEYCKTCSFWKLVEGGNAPEASSRLGTCIAHDSLYYRCVLPGEHGCSFHSLHPTLVPLVAILDELEKEPAKKGFVICPVRGADPEVVRTYVVELEAQGWEIHWPPRDTEQDDRTGGWNICNRNRAAIEAADRVFVYWDGKSYGSHFDLGIAFAYRKPITVLWHPPMKDYAPKSFRKLLAVWELLYGQEVK